MNKDKHKESLVWTNPDQKKSFQYQEDNRYPAKQGGRRSRTYNPTTASNNAGILKWEPTTTSYNPGNVNSTEKNARHVEFNTPSRESTKNMLNAEGNLSSEWHRCDCREGRKCTDATCWCACKNNNTTKIPTTDEDCPCPLAKTCNICPGGGWGRKGMKTMKNYENLKNAEKQGKGGKGQSNSGVFDAGRNGSGDAVHKCDCKDGDGDCHHKECDCYDPTQMQAGANARGGERDVIADLDTNHPDVHDCVCDDGITCQDKQCDCSSISSGANQFRPDLGGLTDLQPYDGYTMPANNTGITTPWPSNMHPCDCTTDGTCVSKNCFCKLKPNSGNAFDRHPDTHWCDRDGDCENGNCECCKQNDVSSYSHTGTVAGLPEQGTMNTPLHVGNNCLDAGKRKYLLHCDSCRELSKTCRCGRRILRCRCNRCNDYNDSPMKRLIDQMAFRKKYFEGKLGGSGQPGERPEVFKGEDDSVNRTRRNINEYKSQRNKPTEPLDTEKKHPFHIKPSNFPRPDSAGFPKQPESQQKEKATITGGCYVVKNKAGEMENIKQPTTSNKNDAGDTHPVKSMLQSLPRATMSKLALNINKQFRDHNGGWRKTSDWPWRPSNPGVKGYDHIDVGRKLATGHLDRLPV